MSGNTRFNTAVNISNQLFTNESNNLVIVNSEDFVDGYLASAFASAYNAPILTVNKDSIDPAIEKEIKDLKPKTSRLLRNTFTSKIFKKLFYC
jgi:N-acetylmuramoyl-L-alanine amidase